MKPSQATLLGDGLGMYLFVFSSCQSGKYKGCILR